MATSTSSLLMPPDHLSATELEELASATESSARQRECKFVVPFPEEVQTECSICIQVLKEPRIISCCGHRFCLECIGQMVTKSCPLCKATQFQYYPDKALERQINQRPVFCLLRNDGCMWTGELRKLTDHFDVNKMNESSNPCQYFPVRCPYCSEHVRRRDMHTHKAQCSYRPSSCKFCGRNLNHTRLMDHYIICPGPVYCTNIECLEVMTRMNLKQHLEVCKWSILDCKYSHSGCTVKVLRKDMGKHLDTNLQKHLDLLSQKCKRLEGSETELKVENEEILCSFQKRIDKLEEEARTKDKISFLVISDLPDEAIHDELKLKSRFGQYGHVANIHLLDSSLRAGIVVYSSSDSCKNVMENRSKGIKLCKKEVQVNPVYTAQEDELAYNIFKLTW